MARNHVLACAPHIFEAILNGNEFLEYRENNIDPRNIQQGDELILKEFDINFGAGATGKELKRTVKNVLTHDKYPCILITHQILHFG